MKSNRDWLVGLILCAGVLLCSLGGCQSLGPTPPPGTPGFVNCSDTALHQAELNLLPAVETALASASWESALLSIAAGVGGPLAMAEVSCTVQWVLSKAEASAAATSDSVEATKAANAKAWLVKYPIPAAAP